MISATHIPMASGGPAADRPDARLRKAAEALEATFLAQMLSQAGLGAARESMGGGAGEEAFAGLLASEQAKLMAARGGIGLAETIFEALKARGGEPGR